MNLDGIDEVDEFPARPRKDIPPADLELLTLAARALGARFEEVDGEGYGNLHFEDGTIRHAWNSLQFSNDAFDLLVGLRLDVCISEVDVCVGDARSVKWLAEAHLSHDASADTRRAVTEAAAEMAKQRS
jgi:hypothetical protein